MNKKLAFKLGLSIILVSGCLTVMAQKKAKKRADADTEKFRYEMMCIGTGTEGTYLVKVFSYSKKPQVAKEQAKKNAVHGIIFKGFPANGRECKVQKPLVRNPNVAFEKEDFLNDFFADGGGYMKFVSLSTDGTPAAGDVIKVNKKEYKVGIAVSVQKDFLRKELEAANIIKKLGAGF